MERKRRNVKGSIEGWETEGAGSCKEGKLCLLGVGKISTTDSVGRMKEKKMCCTKGEGGMLHRQKRAKDTSPGTCIVWPLYNHTHLIRVQRGNHNQEQILNRTPGNGSPKAGYPQLGSDI